jgi:hypothetical protein
MRRALRGVGALTAGSLVAGGVYVAIDQKRRVGFSRAVTFWSKAIPMYSAYRSKVSHTKCTDCC